MNDLFDVSFFRGVLMIVIGVVPAFLVRYLATLAWDNYVIQPRELKAKANRQRQVLLALKEAVEKNRGLIKDIQRYLSDGLPYFNVDLTLLDATASLKWEVIPNADICRQADLVRFELAHAARKVDRLMHLFVDSSARTTELEFDGKAVTAYDFLRSHLVKSLNDHLPSVADRCSELLDLISVEDQRLNHELGVIVPAQKHVTAK